MLDPVVALARCSATRVWGFRYARLFGPYRRLGDGCVLVQEKTSTVLWSPRSAASEDSSGSSAATMTLTSTPIG